MVYRNLRMRRSGRGLLGKKAPRRMGSWRALFLSLLLCSCQEGAKEAAPITLDSLLDEMVSVETDVCFPDPLFTTKHVSSHDPRSVLPGTPSWHANRDNTGFVRYEANNGRVEKVLFDEKGSGVITRIITTGGASGACLRFYLDGEKEASIVIPSYDISRFPVQVPEGMLYRHEHYDTTQGSSFYYPIPSREVARSRWIMSIGTISFMPLAGVTRRMWRCGPLRWTRQKRRGR